MNTDKCFLQLDVQSIGERIVVTTRRYMHTQYFEFTVQEHNESFRSRDAAAEWVATFLKYELDNPGHG